jgi:hypothetical protein
MTSFAAHCGIEDYNEDRCVIQIAVTLLELEF